MTIPTLESILARCKHEGKHLIWQGSLNCGVPRWHSSKHRAAINVRRVVWQNYHGRELTSSELVTTCDNPACLARDCLQLSSKTAAALKGYADPDNRARHKAGVQREAKKARILTPDTARLVKFSSVDPKTAAKFAHCSTSLVVAIRNGVRYKDVRL